MGTLQVLLVFAVVNFTSGDAPFTEIDPGGDGLTHTDVDDDGDYREDGSNTSVPYFEPELGNATLRKCFCSLDEVWNGSACEKQVPLVDILDYSSGFQVTASAIAFGNATIGKVVCPEGTIHIDLGVKVEYPHYQQFFMLESGKLEWGSMQFENYCLEYLQRSKTNFSSGWFAQVCVEPPPIPTCCNAGQFLGADGSCLTSGTQLKFSPNVTLPGHTSTWSLATIKESFVNISCTESEETSVLELNNSTVILEYYLPSAIDLVINNEILHRKYCVYNSDIESGSVYRAKFCYKDQFKDHQKKCGDRTCVRKCCGRYEFFTYQGCSSHKGNETGLLQPKFYDQSGTEDISKPKDLNFVYGVPLCDKWFLVQPHLAEDDEFYLLKSGYLNAPSFPQPYPPTRYCIDLLFVESKEVGPISLVCFSNESSVCLNLQTYLYPVMVFVSLGFLTVTLAVYLSFPELRSMVHGKCLVSYVSALLVAFICLFVVQKATKWFNPITCKFFASLMHFSFLAAFFWLNIMCFDTWWTLKLMRPVPETGELSRLRFKLYSLYSWGCPLVISLISIVIQNLPQEYDILRPDFGEQTCWFRNQRSKWAYFYGFILVLVISNIFFFCHVTFILMVEENHSILPRTRKQSRERMWLYVKLFVVMGVVWVTEVISWQEGSCWGWIITDVINCLQGVFIFIIFVYKKNLQKKVRVKLEPYLRHMKEVIGLTRSSSVSASPSAPLPPTSGRINAALEHNSSSCSENRPSDSAASQSISQSQLSVDPLVGSNRKTSSMPLNVITGVEIHAQTSNRTNAILDSTAPEGDLDQTAKSVVVLPAAEETQHTSQEIDEDKDNEDSVNCDKDFVASDIPSDLTNITSGKDLEVPGDIQTFGDIERNTDTVETNDELLDGDKQIE